MTWVLDGKVAGLVRANEWLGITYDDRIRNARQLPWWWVTLTGLQKRWDALQERSQLDFEKMSIPKDYRVFLSEEWVEEWFKDRERQAKEAREKKDWDA